MKIWRAAHAVDSCQACSPFVQRITVGEPVFDINPAGTDRHLVYCQQHAADIFSERARQEDGTIVVVRVEAPPAELSVDAGVTLDPSLPIAVRAHRTDTISVSELRQRVQRHANVQAWFRQENDRKREQRHQQRATAGGDFVRDRVPGEDDD